MKYIFLLLILIPSYKAISCECYTDNYDSLIKHSDYAFIGKAIRNISPQKNISDSLDKTGYGLIIEFEIDKLIKGSINDQIIIIDQRGTCNCCQPLELGSTYLIFGYNSRTLPSSPIERYQEYISSTEFVNGIDEVRIKYFERYFENLKVERTYLYSDGCHVFTSKSEQYKMVK